MCIKCPKYTKSIKKSGWTQCVCFDLGVSYMTYQMSVGSF